MQLGEAGVDEALCQVARQPRVSRGLLASSPCMQPATGSGVGPDQ